MPAEFGSGATSRRVVLHTGLDAHVLEWGVDASHTHTVCLVHGFLDLAWSWAPVVDAGLAQAFHVVACDVRGHGDSARAGAGGYYHFMDYVADLASLVLQLGRDRVSLVGHSMGGSVVSYYAGAHPERVHRLALLEGLGPPEDPTPPPERLRAWIDSWRDHSVRSQRGHATLDDAAKRLLSHDALLSPELARQIALKGTRRGEDGRWYFKHDPLHATRGPYPFRTDVAESLWNRVTCPVLLVEGAESTFRHAEAEARRRQSAFRDVRSVTLPGAGHMMQRHQPQALAQALLEFLG